MADSDVIFPLVLAIVIIIFSAVMAYTILGYINASSCADTDENAIKAKQYATYYGIAATVVLVLMLIALGYVIYKRYYSGRKKAVAAVAIARQPIKRESMPSLETRTGSSSKASSGSSSKVSEMLKKRTGEDATTYQNLAFLGDLKLESVR